MANLFDPSVDPSAAAPGGMNLFADPHASGQIAAQGAGVKPVAPTPPMKLPAFGNNNGITPSAPAAPAGPMTDEPTFAASDTAPGIAAPDAAMRLRDAATPANPADYDAIKAAQANILNAKLNAVKSALPEGTDFNPATGDNSLWQRARLGMMATTADREKYLRDNLPAGSDVKTITVQGVGPMVVFKTLGSNTYQPVKGTEDVAGKFGDAAAAVPSIATQVGTAAATDGESLLYRLFAQALTGSGERLAELEGNRAQGYNQQPVSADLKSAGTSGATAAGAELGASAASNLVGKGGGILAPTDKGAERMTAQKELQAYDPNLKSLTAFQLGHPLLEAKGNRLAAINPTLGNIAGQQGNTLADLFAKSVSDATGGSAPAIGDQGVQVGNVLYPGLKDVVEKMQTDAAAPLANIPSVSPTVGGQAFQQGANDLKMRLAERTTDKFNAVPAEGVTFDISQPQSIAETMARGLKGQGVPETTTVSKDIGTNPLTDPSTYIPSQRTETTVTPTEVPIGGLSPQISKVVKQLQALNPALNVGPKTAATDEAYPVLKTLRQQFGYAAEYPGAEATPEAKAGSYQARQILPALDESMLKPGEGAPADFVPKMKSAQNASKFQSKVLDNPDMQEAMHTPYPEDVMKLASPDNATFLKTAQRTMKPENYQKFQDAYATAAIREPEKLSALMDSYRKDPSVLDRLVSPGNQGLLKQYGIDMDAVGKSLPKKLLGSTDYNARARMAFDNSDPKALADLVARGGGQDSPIGSNLRGALFQNVLDNSLNSEGKVDMAKAMKATSDVINDGRAAAVLNPEELKRLQAIRTYAAGGDALSRGLGSSIYGSEVAGGALTPTNIILAPRQFLRALGELAEARVQNATWTSNAGTRFVFGKPGGSPPVLPRAAATGAADYELNQKRQEPSVGK